MGAFKFETITPPQSHGGLIEVNGDVLERERNAAYAKGFKDGVNVTKDAMALERNQALSQIKEVLSDMQLTRTEASVAVLRSLEPLLQEILVQICPEALHERLMEHLVTTLGEVQTNALETPVRILAPPSSVEKVEAVCAETAIDVQVVADPSLEELELKVSWADGLDHINLADTRQKIADLLSEFGDSFSEETDERRHNAG